MTLTIPERPGACRWCGCTYERACAGGCSWVNRQQTLCSGCEPLDRAMRTSEGRKLIAEFTPMIELELTKNGRRRRPPKEATPAKKERRPRGRFFTAPSGHGR